MNKIKVGLPGQTGMRLRANPVRGELLRGLKKLEKQDKFSLQQQYSICISAITTLQFYDFYIYFLWSLSLSRAASRDVCFITKPLVII